MGNYRQLGYPVVITELASGISGGSLSNMTYPSRNNSLSPNPKRKGGEKDGSADFDGTFGVG
jgi:hypothetical protein